MSLPVMLALVVAIFVLAVVAVRRTQRPKTVALVQPPLQPAFASARISRAISSPTHPNATRLCLWHRG